MEETKTYTIGDIQRLLANLDNGIPAPDEKRMSRAKLPVPKEYGGGWVTGRSLEDAVANLIKQVKAQLADTFGDKPFDECAECWLSIKKGEERSPSTIANYERLLKNYILPFFGGCMIGQIKFDDIQRYFNSILNLSKSTSVQSKAVLGGIFEYAERNEFIDRNPMRFTYEYSKKVGEKIVLQDDDLVTVINQLDKLKDGDYLYACFLCFTALRRGEILGLKWSDIDFQKQTITVQRNVIFPDGCNDPIVKEPKDGSKGVVYLSSELLKRIRPYKSSRGYIVSGSHGDSEKPVSRSSFTKMWNRIQKAIDLKGATSHSFRATYATMMNAHCDHIDPKALQGALRHKTPDLAIKVYTKENHNKTRTAEMEYDEWMKSQLKQASV